MIKEKRIQSLVSKLIPKSYLNSIPFHKSKKSSPKIRRIIVSETQNPIPAQREIIAQQNQSSARSKPEIRKRRGFTAADSIARRIPGYRNNDYADVDNYLSRHDGPSRLCPLQMTRTDAIPAFPLCVPVPAPPSLIKASKSSVCLESGHPRRGCRGYPKDQETEGAGRY